MSRWIPWFCNGDFTIPGLCQVKAILQEATAENTWLCPSICQFAEILQFPAYTILQRFYGDKITKDGLYKFEWCTKILVSL